MLALKSVGFSLVDVQSDVLLPSLMHTTAVSTDQWLRCVVICLPMCCGALQQVAGVAVMRLVQCTHIPAPDLER